MPGYYYGYGMFWDPTYLLVIIGMLLSLVASALVNGTMRKYSQVRNMSGLTGEEAARRILHYEGLHDVQIECLHSESGDHYDPRTNTVRLSYSNYHSASITSVGVAAHECGHAIQHAQGYVPLAARSMLVPVVNISSRLAMPLILLGVILSWNQTLIQIGIWAFSLSLVFYIATLPVEFNASRRAVEKVEAYGLLTAEENKGCRKILSAAAFTYVAAAAAVALQLLRLVLLYGGGNRRRRD